MIAAALVMLFAAAQPVEERDLSRYFPGYSACLQVLFTSSGKILRHGGAQCERPLSPCSTFKIPNSLIALETGVATGPEFLLKWDGVKRDRPELDQDHTLRTAMRDSVVWYYQELARRIGGERMQRFLDAFGYGNRDTSAGLTCGFADPKDSHGWWVGFVRRGGKTSVFAANILGRDANGRKLRPMVENALVELGVLPPPAGR